MLVNGVPASANGITMVVATKMSTSIFLACGGQVHEENTESTTKQSTKQCKQKRAKHEASYSSKQAQRDTYSNKHHVVLQLRGTSRPYTAHWQGSRGVHQRSLEG
mmetsp:Transcript_6851/g.9836  ORF Transcript_6851/g.9836 Transcript_6851/m.9836 type:complete len:105 (-) Transcript_6851:526-840(-)